MKNKLIALLLLPLTVFAQTMGITAPSQTQADGSNQPAPRTCNSEGFVFQNGQLILGIQNGSRLPHDSFGRHGQSILGPQNGSGRLYLIRGNSDYLQLLLSHPTNTAMSANWESRLDQGQWSAVTINQPNFVINCFGRRPGATGIGYVDCAGVLEVCSYPNANIGAEGSAWSSENKSLADTMSSLNPMNVRTPKLLSNQ